MGDVFRPIALVEGRAVAMWLVATGQLPPFIALPDNVAAALKAELADVSRVLAGENSVKWNQDLDGQAQAQGPAGRGGLWPNCQGAPAHSSCYGSGRAPTPCSMFQRRSCSSKAGSDRWGGRAAVKTTTLPSGSIVVRSRVFQAVSEGPSTLPPP